MTPTRIGLIGLSTSSNAWAPGAWAVQAHLPLFVSSPHYEIVALANSTVQSAQKSIAHHNLGSHVKAYGSPEDLAQDPDVDLVVVSVKVQQHYKLTKPALLAGKDVFVEWPLGANVAEAEELTKLAKSKGVKTVVGVQARADSLISKTREMLENRSIGKVVSTVATGVLVGVKLGEWPADATYYLDINSGGNSLTISFGHFLDTFNHLLGEFTHLSSTLKTQLPTVSLVSPSGTIVDPSYPKTSPDQIIVQGTLSSGAVASLTFRTGIPIDGNCVRWIITGTEGEIEIIAPNMGWQFGPPGSKLRIRRFKDGAGEEVVEDVDFSSANGEKEKELEGLGFLAKNTAKTYEAWREGDRKRFADFEDALVRHRVIDKIRQSDELRKEVSL